MGAIVKTSEQRKATARAVKILAVELGVQENTLYVAFDIASRQAKQTDERVRKLYGPVAMVELRTILEKL